MFKKEKEETIFAHATGTFVALEEVPDPVFSGKMMGEGIAIKPTDGVIVAPVDGEIIQLAETKHAFGIRTALGEEILVHIGLETVALKGEGFEVLTKMGAHVKKGEPLIKADLAYIEANAASTIIPMVVTNSPEDKFEFDWKNVTATVAGETESFCNKTKIRSRRSFPDFYLIIKGRGSRDEDYSDFK
ncbi:PTS system glucose-specific IIA component [Listeria floridensis FSL S10-1187]|uniref:PTS system glucose-specific IIA component n=1 Tax=Listeria floridensis FSL S10-1187 TaxID=1265817 RepID=A0ABP3AZJ2_9LIST|nr:PTS system glucose-specific IIA component [Listeria floridensis FSL S10-1187]